MTRHRFEYALLRVVPRVERGEAINAGVLVYCQNLDYLGARIHLDPDRLRALDPSAAAIDVDAALSAIAATANECQTELGRCFRWLTAPRSTVVQPGPVHTGLTDDPNAEADRLLHLLVRAV